MSAFKLVSILNPSGITFNSGVLALSGPGGMITDGTALFQNSPTVSFGINGSTITASAAGGGGGLSNINVSAGTTSQNLSNFEFANSNGVSFGLNGSTITGSVETNYAPPGAYLTTAAQSNQVVNSINGDTGTFSFNTGSSLSSSRVGNAITFGLASNITTTLQSANANYLTSQSGQAFSAGGGSSAFQTLSFSNANGISFSNNAGQVQASYTVPSVTNSSWTVSDNATSGTVGRLAFTNLNGVSLSLSTGAGGSHTIVGSHNGLTSQSNQAFSAGAASSAFQTLSFQDSNGVSFSNNGGAVRVTHDLMFSSSRPAFSAGAASSTFQTISFQDTNNVSFSNNAGQIRITHALAGTSTGFTGANISGSMTHNSSGLALSLSVAAPGGGGAINVSAGTTSGNLQTIVFSNLNGVSFGLNGSTVTGSVAAAGGGATYDGTHPYDDLMQVVGQVGQGSLIFDPQFLNNASCDRFLVYLQNTNSSNSSGSHSLTFRVGLYTRNGSSLSLSMSFSGSTALTHSGTQGSYSIYSGQRMLPLTFAATVIPEDKYWIGFVSSTSSAGANGSYSQNMISNINSQYTGVFGQASNATMQPRLGQGYYSAATNGMPASVAFSQINGTNSLARRFPIIGFGSGTV